MCSATGAPGVTTAALATGWVWPRVHDRSVIVVDADPAGGGTVAGLLRAESPHGRGVLGLAARSVPVEARDIRRECLDAGRRRPVLAASGYRRPDPGAPSSARCGGR